MSSEIAESIFENVKSLGDLAVLLNSSAEQLRYLIYGCSESLKYTKFTINKRKGGVRTIFAPRSDLSFIQYNLGLLIQDKIKPRASAHGFVRSKSIVTNANLHVRHRVVFNIDLKDFFPSINFGRVRGLFMAKPFLASDKVATALARICCHEGSLPQGSPCSPVISNLICMRLDTQLQKLARTHKCSFTRYADDITFSKRKGSMPVNIVSENEDGDFLVGDDLRILIEGNGFSIHPDKIHLYRNTTRQCVTGLVVNKRVNVPREFVRNIRAMITDWRVNGLSNAEKKHHSNFYRRTITAEVKPPLSKIIEGKLNFLKMVRGPEDSVRRNLQRQLVNVYPEYQKIMEKENNELMKRDLFISHASEDKNDFVRPLVQALIKEGVSVWYDEAEITIGDNLMAKINEGLTKSKYGVVVLSPSFFEVKKKWPEREVSALLALEDSDGNSRVLPIWYNVGIDDVTRRHPLLAGNMAWKAEDYSVDDLAIKFRDFIKSKRSKNKTT